MSGTDRRTFLKGTAVAAGMTTAAHLVDGAWLSLAQAAALPGYFEKELGISDALCAKILSRALEKGGDFADLYFEHTVSNSLSLEDGKVNRAYSGVALGVGIRTVKGDQVGYAFTQELTQEAMLTAAATAATIADQTAVPVAKLFVALRLADYYPGGATLGAAPLSSKLQLVQGTNDRCFSLSKAIVKVSAGLFDQQKRILVVRSDGCKAEDLQPRTYLYANAVAEKDGRREQAGWNFGGRRDLSFFTPTRVADLAQKVVDNALILFEAAQPPAGEMPVVLGPGVTGILLHEAIGHGMEADFNRKKTSTYSAMLGKAVAESSVTIVDDATNPELTGSINVDDEGTPGERTVLVEDGVLRSYLHDRISAQHYGVAVTGNGRRESYQHYPVPRMRNTYMLAGKAKPEDVIGSVKRGIYVLDVANGQVKIGEGDFAFYVSQGRMIEDGKLTAPIKDVNIMGNGPKMLRNVSMVANDLELYLGGAGSCGKSGQSVPVGFGLPTCLVKSMTVGGVKQEGARG
jgi:TldD protein